jgi:hypothetical protein
MESLREIAPENLVKDKRYIIEDLYPNPPTQYNANTCYTWTGTFDENNEINYGNHANPELYIRSKFNDVSCLETGYVNYENTALRTKTFLNMVPLNPRRYAFYEKIDPAMAAGGGRKRTRRYSIKNKKKRQKKKRNTKSKKYRK